MTLLTDRPAPARPQPTGPATPVPGGFRPDVEGLRAVAVLAVLFNHLLRWPRGGFVGVDVFFVLSGFLITGLLLKEHHRSGRISFADFYRRRVRRIIPLAVLVLAVTVGATYALFSTARAVSVATDAWWAAAFLANYHFAAVGTDYWQSEGPPSPLQHYWSLAVEEQFYVVWPILIVVVLGLGRRLGWGRRRSSGLLATVLLALSAASFAFALWQTESSRTWAYFDTRSRAWELGVGALLAIGAPLLAGLPHGLRPVLSWTGLGVVGVALFALSDASAFPGPWAALPVAGAALIVAAGTGAVRYRIFPLTNPVSRYLGRISYALYLWHFPAIVIGLAFLPTGGWRYELAVVGAALALAVVSHYLIEDPVRRSTWLDRSARRRRRADGRRRTGLPLSMRLSMVGGVGLVVALLLVQALAPMPSGTAALAAAAGSDARGQLSAQIEAALGTTAWPQLTPSIGSLSSDAKAPEWVKDGCLGMDVHSDPDPVANAAKCVYGAASATKTAVLTGDSIAISYLPGIRAALGSGWRIHVLTTEQCPFASVSVVKVDNSNFPECDSFRAWALNQIDTLKPDLVLAANAENTVSRLASGAQGNVAVAEYEAGEGTSLARAATSADRVVLLAPPPIGQNLQQCATRLSKPADCTATSTDRRNSEIKADGLAVAHLDDPAVSLVDTTSWFCADSGVCPAFVGTTPVFADAAHLSAAFSSQLGPVLAEVLNLPIATTTAVTSGAGQAGGSLAALQAGITSALAATTWPTLTPSFDSVLQSRQYPEDVAGCAHTDLSKPDSCSFGQQGAKTILVVGDSMALKLIPTVRAAYEAKYHIKGIIMTGCPVLDYAMTFQSADASAMCMSFRQKAVAEIQAEKPDVVLVTDNYGASALGTQDGSHVDAWQRAASELVTELKPSVDKLVLLSSPPTTNDPKECYGKLTKPSDCVLKISQGWTDGFQAEQAAATLGGVTYLDTHLWYCSQEGYCPVFAGSTPMKIDRIHLSAPYAALIAPVLKEALATTIT